MISHIDHVVITARSLETTLRFYERVLGFERSIVPGSPAALSFGTCKLSVHEAAHTFEPKAATPTPGSADFCLIASVPLATVIAHLGREGVALELGPVERSGARGPITSVYFRDPDGNLVEVSEYRAS